jgi:polyphosphate glucokinase
VNSDTAIGIDIGGTGIKGAVIDLSTGELLSERVKLPTPEGGKPNDIVDTTRTIVENLVDIAPSAPIGICFPAVVKNGVTMSAANVSPHWIGLQADKLFENSLGRVIRFVNDADAAGYAESRFGAARDVKGLVIMSTLGTGIGSALIYNGVLIPNTELGHLEIHGHDYETRASAVVREREDLSWERWAKRLQKYYSHLEFLFSPDLIIVGGGVSKQYKSFLPLITLQTPLVPAVHRNNAGIIGAGALAALRTAKSH